ncbi:PREDICTED: desmocollin-1-like [Thamnophis sirtalis]|uniref:Desmocollin-1-like n=1 Tax=Thamnophis sirtalis TaxID=35019 RepID=A0A6I9XB80_9SAUR|nr:PREDICTED: desmocollin-1-like [Thamnophis sirtalis]
MSFTSFIGRAIARGIYGQQIMKACPDLKKHHAALDLFCEACNEVSFNVPHKLKMGMFIGRVKMKHCLNDTGIIGINNPNFVILEDGSLYTKNAISLTTHESIITVFLKNVYTHEQKRIYVSLLTYPQKDSKTKRRHVRSTVVGRTKRRWAPVPTIIMENSLGPFPMQIQQLSSDMALKYNIRYFITGPGVDKPPLNYFYIEQETGNLFVTCPIDREEYPEFQLICYAMTPDGYTPEIPLIHLIKIEDDNDNTPEFEYNIYTFHVPENSIIGTIVGQVTAKDKDEPNTLHSKVKYRIISQSHQKLQEFVIDPDSGCITVALHLDRETVPTYTLNIEARDMGGEEFGLYTTAPVHIEIGDVNDNLPQIAQSMYVVEVYENIEHAEILCIPVEDKDESRTSSWMGIFVITKGNEDNSFAIRVDPQQNIGCLSTLKELDYEKSHERRLEIVINNEAPYVPPPNSRALQTSVASIVVKIKDQDEGPVFESCEYILHISERLLVGTVVGNYQAMDPETGNKHLSYKIIKDPCGWITIDESGNLRTTESLESDSKIIEYSQCNVTVSAIDQSGKTGNGTIVIVLMIENNYPVSTSKHYVMCKDKKTICINATDINLPMSTIPYHFEIEKPVDLKWKLTPNDVGFGAPYGLWLYRKRHTSQEESDLTFENVTRSNTEAPGEGNIRPNIEAPREGNTRPNTEASGNTGNTMVFLCGEDEERNVAKEYLHAYNYEGKDSPTGTLSSCTGESEEEKLSFLNEPEPPFRTLVEVFVQKDCV